MGGCPTATFFPDMVFPPGSCRETLVGAWITHRWKGFLVNYYETNFLTHRYRTSRSKSIREPALIKIQFQPAKDMDGAMAETGPRQSAGLMRTRHRACRRS